MGGGAGDSPPDQKLVAANFNCLKNNQKEMIGNRSEFAKWLGVSPAYVTELAGKGRLVLVDGGKRVDFEASKELIGRTADMGRANNGSNATRGRPPTAGVESKVSPEAIQHRYNIAKAKTQTHIARQEELREQEMADNLLNREAMVRAVYTGFRQIRDNFNTLGAKIAPKCAGKSVREIQNMIDDEVRAAFAAFEAKTIEDLAAKE